MNNRTNLNHMSPSTDPDQRNIALNADDLVAMTTKQAPGAMRLLE